MAVVKNLDRRKYFCSSNMKEKIFAPLRDFEPLQPLHRDIDELRHVERVGMSEHIAATDLRAFDSCQVHGRALSRDCRIHSLTVHLQPSNPELPIGRM